MEDLVERVSSHPKVCILTDDKNTPAAISQALLRRGLGNARVYICENLGYQNERIVQTTLSEAGQGNFASLNLMIIIDSDSQIQASDQPLLGIPDDSFKLRSADKSLITKLEIRAVSLAKMGLTEDSIVWDIGAGSGAMSVEASQLARQRKSLCR